MKKVVPPLEMSPELPCTGRRRSAVAVEVPETDAAQPTQAQCVLETDPVPPVSLRLLLHKAETLAPTPLRPAHQTAFHKF